MAPRRRKTKNKGVGHIDSLLRAHNAVVTKHFTDAPFVPYTFRHTFASRCAEAGVGLVELSALLGHTDVKTAMRYIHVLKEQKVQAVGKLENYIELKKQFKLRAEARTSGRARTMVARCREVDRGGDGATPGRGGCRI